MNPLVKLFNNIQLSGKGLLLILVPVIFQLVFLASLLATFNKSNAELHRVARARAIVERMQTCDWLMVRFLAGLASYLLTGNPYWKESLYKCKDERANVGIDLEALLASDPESLEQIVKSNQEIEVMTAIINRANNKIESGDMRHLLTVVSRVTKLLRSSNGKLHAIENKYRLVSSRAPQAMARARLSLLIYTGLAVIISTLSSCLLAASFAASISNRLKVLSENTSLFSKGEPLLEQLDGKDEIAFLDKSFHQMASEVELSRRKERAILENAVDLHLTMDKAFVVLAASKNLARIWAYQPEQVIGRYIGDFLAITDHETKDAEPANFEALKTKLETGQRAEIESAILKGDGAQAFFLLSFSCDADHVYAIAHDVSERKKLEKMKRDFVKILTNDLRRPLLLIEENLTRLQNEFPELLEPRTEKILSNSEKSAERLIDLVNELLSLEKVSLGRTELNRKWVSISELFETSAAAVGEFARKEGIGIEQAPLNKAIHVDPGKVTQVLVNLLSNAVKFSPASSLIRLEAEEKSNLLEIRVVDQGRGVPAEMQEKIFQRFEQVESSDATVKGGFGLGLPICRSIIEEHGGSMGCRSAAGKGSTFWIKLNLAAETQAKNQDSIL